MVFRLDCSQVFVTLLWCTSQEGGVCTLHTGGIPGDSYDGIWFLIDCIYSKLCVYIDFLPKVDARCVRQRKESHAVEILSIRAVKHVWKQLLATLYTDSYSNRVLFHYIELASTKRIL